MIESLEVVLNKPHQSPEELISDGILIKGGKAALWGKFKAGKTTLITYIAECLAGGIPIFSKYKTQRSKVLYVQLEIPHTAFLIRLENNSLSRIPEVRKNLFVTTEFFLKLDREIGWLDKALSEVKPDVLIIDPYYKVLSGAEDYEHITRFADNLDIMMEKYEVALILTAQGRKAILSTSGTVDMGDEEMRGSTALAGWVDSIIGLRVKAGTKRRLTFTLRHGVKENLDLLVELDKDTGLYAMV